MALPRLQKKILKVALRGYFYWAYNGGSIAQKTMANLRIAWNRPTIVPYATLSSVFPGVVWQNPQQDFRAREFRVQYRRVGDANWLEAGTTRDTAIEIRGIPDGIYQARVATIDLSGRASAWVASGEQGTIVNWVARFSEPNHTLALGVF